MDQHIKEIIWQQIGAACKTLEKAIDHCPEDHWDSGPEHHKIWYWAYHTIFWLDYYISYPDDNFTPPPPFTMSEMDPSGKMPDEVYSKEQLLTYLKYSREKAKETILNLNDERANEIIKFGKLNMTFDELILYTMRHLQHHSAQLNLLLRQKIGSAPGWTFRADG